MFGPAFNPGCCAGRLRLRATHECQPLCSDPAVRRGWSQPTAAVIARGIEPGVELLDCGRWSGGTPRMAPRHRAAPDRITWPHASESGNGARVAFSRLRALDASPSEGETRLCTGSLAGNDRRFTRDRAGRDHTHWLSHRSQLSR